MDRALTAFLLVVGLAAAAYPAMSATPASAPTRSFTLEVTASTCAYGDGVCLAYNGQVPGPTLDVDLGDIVEITLVNRIAQTLPPGASAHLATVPVSWHVHGTALPVASDGVGSSSALPGGSYTYTARAAFPGTWHYHDHVLGFDGDEGARRGLYGSLVVRNSAEPRADVVLDLHMLDSGANGGRGLSANVPAGSDVEIVVVGLENANWDVSLRDPAGRTVGSFSAWPGLSGRIRADDVVPGTYEWRAAGRGIVRGTVVVP